MQASCVQKLLLIARNSTAQDCSILYTNECALTRYATKHAPLLIKITEYLGMIKKEAVLLVPKHN